MTVFIVCIGDVESHSTEKAEGRGAGREGGEVGGERRGGGGGRSDDEGKAGERAAQEGERAAVERGKGGADSTEVSLVSSELVYLVVCWFT